MVSPLLKKTLRDIWGYRTQVFAIAMILAFGLSLFVTSWNTYKSLLKTQTQFNISHHFGDVFADFYPASSQFCREFKQMPDFTWLNCATRTSVFAKIAGQVSSKRGYLQTVPDNTQAILDQLYFFKSRIDVKSTFSGLIVHKAFAEANRINIGDKITLSREGIVKDFKVSAIGVSPEFVYALSPETIMPDNSNYGVFWLPESAYHAAFGGADTFNFVSGQLSGHNEIYKIKKALEQRLLAYRPFVYPRAKQLSHMFVTDEIAQQRVTALFMPSIFLLIATFMVQMLLSRIVSLQRSQIATLKACGYSDFSLFKHYFLMITMIVALGCFLGIGLSIPLASWMVQMYREYFMFPNLNITIEPLDVFYALLAILGVVTASCYFSFKNIVTLNPAEAMRPPMPPDYHKSFLNRIIRQWNIRAQTKMILRGIFSRPIRWTVSTVSISAALAIIVLSLFWGDMVDYIMKMQFSSLQKEDLSVAMKKPIAVDALDTLKSKLGILQLEAYRDIPVKIKLSTQEKLLSLTIFPAQASLRRIALATGEKLSIPVMGIAVSKNFRDKYGLRVGDLLPLEIMEPPKRVISLPIAYFFDSFIGESIIASKAYMDKILAEGNLTNQILLRLSPLSDEVTEQILKEYPSVSFVFNKNRTYKIFKELVIDAALSFTYILTVLAMLMSVGIAYNFARINFSERSWELASLSVLGFSRRMVFSLFIKEILIQFVLAWLPGIFLGRMLAGLSLKMISTEVFFFPLIIYPKSYIIASGVTIVAFGLSIGAIYQVFRKLNLTDALKVRE